MKEMKRENRFSDMLRNLISQYGITQTELARNLGLKPNTISMYCSGNSRPDMDTLLEIASYFGVSTDYLITGEKPENMTLREELNLSDKAIENLKNQKDNLARNVLLSDEKFYKEFSGAINVFLGYRFLAEKEKSSFLTPLGINRKLDLLTVSVFEPSRIMNNYFIEFFNNFGKYLPDNKINNQE